MTDYAEINGLMNIIGDRRPRIDGIPIGPPPSPPERQVVCSRCGDPTGEFSATERTRLGRCCRDLPSKWVEDRETGLYTANRDDDDDDDDDDVDERAVPPECGHCGHDRFVLRWQCTETMSARSVIAETAEITVFIDLGNGEGEGCPEDSDHVLTCESCGLESEHRWDWL